MQHMGSQLLERAEKALEERRSKADKTPASSSADAGVNPKAVVGKATVPTPDTEASDDQASSPGDTAPPESNVVDITAKAIDALSDAEVEAAIANETPEAPGVARLVATRETKATQMQYDGTTPEGWIIRVWVPEGGPMLTTATLTEA